MSDVEPLDASTIFDRNQMTGQVAIRTLLLTDFVDSTAFVEAVGDRRASDVFGQHDRLVRDLVVAHGGREIDKTDGFLLVFRRPVEAVEFALAYHDALKTLSAELGVQLTSRAAIHLGEVQLRANAPEDVERGAKPVELEGLAKPTVARIMGLAVGGQTLLSDSAFEMARRASVGNTALNDGVKWLHHGPYRVKGVEEAIQVYEVGRVGAAPLTAPAKSEKAWPVGKQRKSAVPGLLLLLGLVGVGGWLFAQKPAATDSGDVQEEVVVAPETVEEAAAPVDMTIRSEPSGATIVIDGQTLGQAPVVFAVEPGRTTVLVEASLDAYITTEATCAVEQDVSTLSCDVVLKSVPKPTTRVATPVSKPPVSNEASEGAGGTEQPTTENKKRKPKIDLID